MKTALPNLMTTDYVRVRKSTIKELEALLEKQQSPDWHVVAAIFGMVIAVAITGLIMVL